jgi:hypothetical protein
VRIGLCQRLPFAGLATVDRRSRASLPCEPGGFDVSDILKWFAQLTGFILHRKLWTLKRY